MKTCGTCKVEKPFEAFYARKTRSSDGYRNVCKECERVANAASYSRHAEARRADAVVRSAEWRKVPGNAERNQAMAADWYERPGNAARVTSTVRRWRAENPRRHLEACRAYRRSNRATIAAHIKRYKLRKIEAVPDWANLFFIEEAYDLAAKRTEVTGYPWEVDHVVPLRSLLVCGFHVEHNLAVVPKVYNRHKGNRFWPDMPA